MDLKLTVFSLRILLIHQTSIILKRKNLGYSQMLINLEGEGRRVNIEPM